MKIVVELHNVYRYVADPGGVGNSGVEEVNSLSCRIRVTRERAHVQQCERTTTTTINAQSRE